MYLSVTRRTTFKLDNTAAVYQMKKKTRILFNLCTQQPNIKIFSAADLRWVLSCFQQHTRKGTRTKGVEMKYRSIMYKNRL